MGEQEITKSTTVPPPGLTGNLTGVPLCPEQTSKRPGRRRDAGVGNPRVRQASEIGHTVVEAGVGTVLAQTPGKLYLAGPYHGAPLSVLSVTAAKVGPFDLGTVVIRFALNIDPVTAQVEINGATSDAIPHIIDGIVVHVRDIRAYVDREKFIENPTSCNPLSVSDTIYGVNPANQGGGDAGRRVEFLPGGGLPEPAVQADVQGFDVLEVQPHGRDQPDREARVPGGGAGDAGEHSPGQGGTPQTAAVEVEYVAESVHGGGVRSEPRELPVPPRSSGTRRRSPRSSPNRWKAPRTSSATVARSLAGIDHGAPGLRVHDRSARRNADQQNRASRAAPSTRSRTSRSRASN